MKIFLLAGLVLAGASAARAVDFDRLDPVAQLSRPQVKVPARASRKPAAKFCEEKKENYELTDENHRRMAGILNQLKAGPAIRQRDMEWGLIFIKRVIADMTSEETMKPIRERLISMQTRHNELLPPSQRRSADQIAEEVEEAYVREIIRKERSMMGIVHKLEEADILKEDTQPCDSR